MNKVKLSLKLEEWPTGDRRAFDAARDDDDGANGGDIGLAAFWSEAWRKSVIKRYGMWLHFLQRHGWLDPEVRPMDRLTENRLEAYRKELHTRVASETRASYLLGMSEALRVMERGRKRPKCLRKLVRGLARTAQPSRDEHSKLVAPYQLYRAGLRRMRRYEKEALVDPKAAAKFEDGLMMAMIVAKALRLKNFAGMLRERNIERNALDQYEVKFAKAETKNKVRIHAELPRTLTKYIDHWLGPVRTMLLNGRRSDAMWITSLNTDMALMTVYGRFCKATQEELDKRINPHFVRKIVATGIAYATPAEVSITPVVLDQKDPRTERESYRVAGNFIGSAEHIRLLEIRRKRAFEGGFG